MILHRIFLIMWFTDAFALVLLNFLKRKIIFGFQLFLITQPLFLFHPSNLISWLPSSLLLFYLFGKVLIEFYHRIFIPNFILLGFLIIFLSVGLRQFFPLFRCNFSNLRYVGNFVPGCDISLILMQKDQIRCSRGFRFEGQEVRFRLDCVLFYLIEITILLFL